MRALFQGPRDVYKEAVILDSGGELAVGNSVRVSVDGRRRRCASVPTLRMRSGGASGLKRWRRSSCVRLGGFSWVNRGGGRRLHKHRSSCGLQGGGIGAWRGGTKENGAYTSVEAPAGAAVNFSNAEEAERRGTARAEATMPAQAPLQRP